MAPRRPAKVKNATSLKNGVEIVEVIAPLQLNGSANLETDLLELDVENKVDFKTIKKKKVSSVVEEVKSTKNKAKQQGRKPMAQKVDIVRSESPVYEDTVDDFDYQENKLTNGKKLTEKSSASVKSTKNKEKGNSEMDNELKKPIAAKGRPRKALPKTNESDDDKIGANGDILNNQEIVETNFKTKGRKGAKNKIDQNSKTSKSSDIKSVNKSVKPKNRTIQEENTTDVVMMTKLTETTETDIDSEKSEKVISKGKIKNNKKKSKQGEEPVEVVVTSETKKAKEPKGKKKNNIDNPPKRDFEEPVQQLKSENTKERKPKGKKKVMENTDPQSGVEPAPKKRKVNKKDEKGQGDIIIEDSESATGNKPKGKRGAKRRDISEAPEGIVEEPVSKRRRKPTDENVIQEDKKKKAPLKNKSATQYEELDFTNSSKNAIGKEWNFKISSWNVDGLRAWITKGGLDYLKYEKPNILCLQETKCSQDKLPEEINVPGYHTYWLGSDKDGYAGVGIFTTKMAINVQYGLQNEELDSEGRIITAEYEQFYLISTYVPNAGRKLVTLPKRLQWNDEFRKFVKELDKKKPVIVCGDMNVAHQEIDLANPKTNKRNAGFTEEERTGMSELLGDGFVDTFRHFYPDHVGAYTFWTYMMNSRAKNVGWRLDYFIVSERLLPMICDNVIRSEVYGSDHCPISLFMHLTSAEKPKEP